MGAGNCLFQISCFLLMEVKVMGKYRPPPSLFFCLSKLPSISKDSIKPNECKWLLCKIKQEQQQIPANLTRHSCAPPPCFTCSVHVDRRCICCWWLAGGSRRNTRGREGGGASSALVEQQKERVRPVLWALINFAAVNYAKRLHYRFNLDTGRASDAATDGQTPHQKFGISALSNPLRTKKLFSIMLGR